MTLICLLLKFAKYCPAGNIHIQFFSDEKLENSKFWTFWNFPVTCTAMHMKKCITFQVFLVNFRPSSATVGCRFVGASRGFAPLDPRPRQCDGPAGYMFQTKKRKTSTTRDATDQVASPAASPHHATSQ